MAEICNKAGECAVANMCQWAEEHEVKEPCKLECWRFPDAKCVSVDEAKEEADG